MSQWTKKFDLHRFLLADQARTENFRRAISQTVRPGDVVLDLGTGTGILAFFACQAGARKVYAIEADEVVEIAEQVCLKNGLQEHIVFVHGLSSRMDLPEKVDVLVSDPELSMFSAVLDARRRWLKDGGRIIPQAVEFSIVPVEDPEAYQRSDFWTSNIYGFDFSSFRPLAVNNLYGLRVDRSSFLSDPVSLARVAFSDAKTPEARGEASFVAQRAGTLHGISGWYTTEIAQDEFLPGSPPILRPDWGHIFFPLETAVPLAAGDSVSIALQAVPAGKDYVWSWNTRVRDDSGQVKANFKQSTFFGIHPSAAQLRKQASSHVPMLNEEGRIDQFILASMTDEVSLGETANRTLKRFPDYFAHWQDALNRVCELSRKYSR